MNKLKTPIIIVAIIIVLALIKIFFLAPKKFDRPPAAGAPKQSVTVSAYIVKPEILDNDVYSSGSVSANEQAELRPEVSGKIIFLNITEGGRVSKGDLLVKINDSDLQAQLKKLKLQLSLSEEKEVRLKLLLAINGVSKEEYDIIYNQVELGKADIEDMQAQIAKTEIRAPFNGVLGLRTISQGAYVTPSTLLATMQQIDPLKVDFSVPEKYMDKIKKGDQVLFSVQGVDGSFSAKIYAIDPKIDPSTRTVQLRAVASNDKGKIFPGAFAKVQLLLKQTPDAIMVPTESIIPVLKGQKVYLYKNGKAQEQAVETGVRTPAKIEIVQGLQIGDTVVTTGMMYIKQNALLKLSKTY
ncbi:MAG TPA: efflux RND transporter periplasmic adaptor subunit [Cytophagaceae bacterium]|jgi:membrane fusion protein (multidrug efflux system)|nr:efflux RND transporter periplasmic adaptor subunit [Cytophagaceae bacterium]